MTSRQKIVQKAMELVQSSPEGRRYSDLVKEIGAAFPEIPANTIHGSLWKWRGELPAEIYQPSRGLYRAIKYREPDNVVAGGERPPRGVREEDFYGAFGDWLVNELEECTKAITVGGNLFKDRWGTPDVVGVRKARESDIIKPTTEVVSAEIKLDPNGLITAFGQACAYRLFSHKSYIVVPNTATEDDIARLDALSRIFGIGLVVFDPSDPKNPGFAVRSRAAREEPDMFYVNQRLKLIEDELFG
jgi:hypothetical protein